VQVVVQVVVGGRGGWVWWCRWCGGCRVGGGNDTHVAAAISRSRRAAAQPRDARRCCLLCQTRSASCPRRHATRRQERGVVHGMFPAFHGATRHAYRAQCRTSLRVYRRASVRAKRLQCFCCRAGEFASTRRGRSNMRQQPRSHARARYVRTRCVHAASRSRGR